MNFDEASEHEDDVEEERTRSLSPNTDGTRPSSAASGKDISVSVPTNVLTNRLQDDMIPTPALNIVSS